MSKIRLVVTAVVVEGRTHADVGAQYGMSRSWVTRLVARYRTEGDTAFEPRSRRPHTSPTRVADVMNQRIVNLRAELTNEGLDAGPVTIQWHLHRVDKTGAVSLRRGGRMHHISIGRAHAGTTVILLIDNLDIRVINASTGELLRSLTLNPEIGYQPRTKK